MPSPQFPIERVFSERTQGFYGYKDARVMIRTKVLGPIPAKAKLTADEIKDAIAFLQEALLFANLPQEERDRIGAD